MIICKPLLRHYTTDMVLKTTNYTIEQSKKVKVLGVYITSGLSNDATVNDMISKINFRLHLIRKVIRYTNYRTSRMVMNSIIISVFNYGSPLLINSNFCPVLLYGQKMFCPGQKSFVQDKKKFCPGQKIVNMT